MKTKKVIRKITVIISILAMVITMIPSVAFAAIPELDTKANTNVSFSNYVPVYSWDLGGFTFTNTNIGAARTYNFNYMRIKPAWKASDSETSEVDLLIKVIRASDGTVVYQKRFTLSDDVNGKDKDGWWYAESEYFRIDYGQKYYFFYEAFTTPGYTPTGYNRGAQVHMWLNLSDEYPY